VYYAYTAKEASNFHPFSSANVVQVSALPRILRLQLTRYYMYQLDFTHKLGILTPKFHAWISCLRSRLHDRCQLGVACKIALSARPSNSFEERWRCHGGLVPPLSPTCIEYIEVKLRHKTPCIASCLCHSSGSYHSTPSQALWFYHSGFKRLIKSRASINCESKAESLFRFRLYKLLHNTSALWAIISSSIGSQSMAILHSRTRMSRSRTCELSPEYFDTYSSPELRRSSCIGVWRHTRAQLRLRRVGSRVCWCGCRPIYLWRISSSDTSLYG
jgi:hypothetical protein